MNKSREVYRRWLAMTRPGPGPDGQRRPEFLMRHVTPKRSAFRVAVTHRRSRSGLRSGDRLMGVLSRLQRDTATTVDQAVLRASVGGVEDPELKLSLDEAGMLDGLAVHGAGHVTATVRLTTATCPLRRRLEADVRAAALSVDGVTEVRVEFTTMDEPERMRLAARLRAGAPPDAAPVRPRLGDPGLRRGQRQGRRGQVDGHREPGRGARGPGPAGGRARRRRVGVLGAPAVRGATGAGRPQGADAAGRGARRLADVGGLPRRRRAGRLARPHAAQGDRAVPRRRALGRPRRAPRRPPAGHR